MLSLFKPYCHLPKVVHIYSCIPPSVTESITGLLHIRSEAPKLPIPETIHFSSTSMHTREKRTAAKKFVLLFSFVEPITCRERVTWRDSKWFGQWEARIIPQVPFETVNGKSLQMHSWYVSRSRCTIIWVVIGKGDFLRDITQVNFIHIRIFINTTCFWVIASSHNHIWSWSGIKKRKAKKITSMTGYIFYLRLARNETLKGMFSF